MFIRLCRLFVDFNVQKMWQHETNTFYPPFGDMIITLDDVRILLQIPMDGKAVVVDSEGFIKLVQLLQKVLGVTEADATKELSLVRGNVVD
ncbi:hypothetical protein Syun_030126 [Stephania yunnanensis]|uniref:Aminotransferase-like plant mobile domain-containing protein n=1 Tax=Stephania yunnanensis TaxID=152371 RepID=A0AAP0HK84_9MAGN